MDFVWRYLKYYEIKRLALANSDLYNILQRRETWSELLFRDMQIRYNDDDAMTIYSKIKQMEQKDKIESDLYKICGKYREYVGAFLDLYYIAKPLLCTISERYGHSFKLLDFITNRSTQPKFNINAYNIEIDTHIRYSEEIANNIPIRIFYKHISLVSLRFQYPSENEQLLRFLEYLDHNDLDFHLIDFIKSLNLIYINEPHEVVDYCCCDRESCAHPPRIYDRGDYIIKHMIRSLESIDDNLYHARVFT